MEWSPLAWDPANMYVSNGELNIVEQALHIHTYIHTQIHTYTHTGVHLIFCSIVMSLHQAGNICYSNCCCLSYAYVENLFVYL